MSGRVRVSGADFLRGRSFGAGRKSGASVDRGVEGALEGPQEASGVLLMVMAGGKEPIFLLVASCVTRSYSRTSSIVMSAQETHSHTADHQTLNIVNTVKQLFTKHQH